MINKLFSTFGRWAILTLIVVAVIGGFYLLGAMRGERGLTERQGVVAAPSPVSTGSPSIDLTADWKTYTNAIYGYEIKYPPTWTALAPTPGVSETTSVTEIRKDINDYLLNNFVIQSAKDVTEENVALESMIRGAQDLSGWKSKPAVEKRYTKQGVAARILQGEYEGRWFVWGFIMHERTFIQITWADTPDREEQQRFELIFSSLQFAPR